MFNAKTNLLIFLLYVLVLSSKSENISQLTQTYVLTVKDENAQEIGSYFDIRIDNLLVLGDTTINLQMIPNLGIQDSSLQLKYSTFLEMLRRSTGKEKEAVIDTAKIIGPFNSLNKNWGSTVLVSIPEEYNGTDDTLAVLFDDLNVKLGYKYFIVTTMPVNRGWVFNLSKVDWRLDRKVRKEIEFNGDGTPKKCTFHIQGLFKYGNDLRYRVRRQIAEALLLNRSYSPELIDTPLFDKKYFRLTAFSPDFIAMVKVMNALSQGRDFQNDLNEVNRNPVANAGPDQKEIQVGKAVTLDATHSLDPDGELASYRWRQVFGTKTGIEYITANQALLSDSTLPVISFTPQWPGNYRFQVMTTDRDGKHDLDLVDVKVNWMTNPFEVRGINNFAYFDSYVDVNQYTQYILARNAGWIEFAPYGWMETKYSNNVHLLAEYTPGAPGFTISDQHLVALINAFRAKGLKVLLRPTLEFYNWTEWRGGLEPTDWSAWFESYKIFLNHYASIAEQTGVELFTVGNELKNANYHTEKWREVISGVRGIYHGKLTYSDSDMQFGMYIIDFWDALDIIGIDYAYPITGRGDYWDTGNEKSNDPSYELCIKTLEKNLDNVILPRQQAYNKPVLITELDCSNYDGVNYQMWNFYYDDTMTLDNQERVNYYEAMLQAIAKRSWIKGTFIFERQLKLDYNFAIDEIPFTFDIKDGPLEMLVETWYK